MARKSRKNVAAPEMRKMPAEKIWRAALYIRLSVEFNGKRGDSLETQQQIMEAYGMPLNVVVKRLNEANIHYARKCSADAAATRCLVQPIRIISFAASIRRWINPPHVMGCGLRKPSWRI